jgi:hypothetical protein
MPAWMLQPRWPMKMTEPTKPRLIELFLSPIVQILIPNWSECTSARPDYAGGPEDTLVLDRRHLTWRAPTEIPIYWMKRSPSERRSLEG